MEFIDLSPYEYRAFPIPMRSVGWLGRKYGLQGSRGPHVKSADLKRLKAASRRLGAITLGTHECEFCSDGPAFEGNGEYRYYMPNGDAYSAPMMILHYVEEHGYRPPDVFLDCLEDVGGLVWDWRAARLRRVLLDASEDLDFRCEAIIDLANWKDPRSLEALISAIEDEDLIDVAGDEIGRSLGSFLGCEFAGDLRVEDFSGEIRRGIDEARWH
ncbi:HEAT repeat domain-containing protein [Micromonospora sp. NPDC050397]|uniref:HEAT repeat domain-containing protein n=1 Tax=Micromonospora sp. NPDC050397 TaxID=3364279 RepID=UPI0038503850